MSVSNVMPIELNDLLSETLAAAQNRQRQTLDQSLRDLNRFALFGAGNIGRATLQRLRRRGFEPLAFIDDTPAKEGTVIDGLAVYGRQQAAETLGQDITVIVTILNSNLTFIQARTLLAEAGLRAESFMLLSWAFPEDFADLCNTTRPETLLLEGEKISACNFLWADEVSRDTYARQIGWRATLDFDLLPEARLEDIYFPDDLELDLDENITFIDAGAYDGDTLFRFLDYSGESFSRVVCIEPDPENHAKLMHSIKARHLDDRVSALNCGLGEKSGVLSFNSTGDMSAAFGEGGSHSIAVRTLKDVMPDGCPVYAKFDIEGAEWGALNGSADCITENAPKLAVSVYHRPADLWRLPLRMAELLPGRRIYLRAHGVDGTDVICYAL